MKRLILSSCATLAMAFAPAATLSAQETATATAPAVEAQATGSGPALWKIADEDTTIYLFGTVHILPANIVWFGGDIEAALNASDMLVTEIPGDAMDDPAAQAGIMGKAQLPAGKSLRGMLSEEQLTTYDAAMTQLGMPPAAFDRFEPWFAGITLAMVPLMQAGYNPNSGAEEVLEAAAGPDKDRGALETLDEQMNMLDGLPMESQIKFMMDAAKDPARTVAMTDELVNEWAEGDVEAIARLNAEEMSDPTVSAVLLYDRNERWAEWIDNRMDVPGSVFIAVGAAHLAGEKSVQDFLNSREIEVTRIQ